MSTFADKVRMQNDSKLRERSREVAAAILRLMWREESGEERYASVKAIDMSESGLRVLTPHALEPRTFVTLQCDALGLRGSASVRYCTRKGINYIAGLEFTGGMFRGKPTYD
jgi:hypothetical protein